jgi:hypothetical protein
MATLVTSYTEIGFSILPNTLNSELQQDLVKDLVKPVVGFVSYDKNTTEYKFVYEKHGGYGESHTHWSIDIIKKLPYCEVTNTWIVFNCPPHKTNAAYQRTFGESIYIYQWDTWFVESIDTKVAVVTSWEIK